MEGSGLGDSGVTMLSHALENNSNLKELILSKNFKGKCYESLSFMLKFNIWIGKLDLDWNSISKDAEHI